MTTPQFGVPSPAPQQTGRWAQQATDVERPASPGGTGGRWANSPAQSAVSATVATQTDYRQSGYHTGIRSGAPLMRSAAGYPVGVRPHKKSLAALFAFLWSSIGAANFYLGYWQRGFAQMATGAVGICIAMMGPLVAISSGDLDSIEKMAAPMFIGMVIWFCVLVWGWIEFVMILMGAGPYRRDARGHDLV